MIWFCDDWPQGGAEDGVRVALERFRGPMAMASRDKVLAFLGSCAGSDVLKPGLGPETAHAVDKGMLLWGALRVLAAHQGAARSQPHAKTKDIVNSPGAGHLDSKLQ